MRGSPFVASGVANSTFEPNSSDSVRYVSTNGSDTKDGLTAANAMRTPQAAYTSLPSTGGTVLVAPGRYDVAAGWNLSRGKPLELVGLVKPQKYLTSDKVTPVPINAAVFYTSTGAASMITTTGGTAANRMDGCKFQNLVFELSAAATKVALDLNSVNFAEVTDNIFYADKTTGPAAVDAVGVKNYAVAPGTYGGDDASWARITNNVAANMALCQLGNASGTLYSANQHVVRDNVGLGLAHANTSTLPFISIWGGHRCVTRDNNVEAYNIGIQLQSCWDCRLDGDGGELVDVFIDMVNTKGCYVSPIGIAYAALGSNAATTPILAGALLVRGDASTKANIIVAQDAWTSGNTQRMANPTDDGTHPYLSLASVDNVVQSPRNSLDQAFATTAQLNAITSVSVVALTADATAIASSTALTSIGLALPVSASATEVWFFDAFLLINAANATMDLKVGLSGPASSTAAWGNGDVAGASQNPGFYVLATTSSPSQALGIGGVVTLGTVNGQQMVHVSGWVFGGGTAGNLNVQLAQNTSDVGNLVAKKGSHLKYYKVAA